MTMTNALCFVYVLWLLPFPTSMQMLPWGCHIWHLRAYNTKCFCLVWLLLGGVCGRVVCLGHIYLAVCFIF